MNELRYALRALRRTPTFTGAVILTLAMGIGAATAMAALVHAVLLRPLSYPDADRLVTVRHTVPGLGLADAGQSLGTYHHYREHNTALEGIGVWFEDFLNLSEGEPERIRIALVTPSVLTLLGAKPLLGRLLTEEDDAAGAETGVLISHGLWVRRFGADPGIIGRTFRGIGLAGERDPAPRPVLGVLPPGFDFPHRDTQVWYSIGRAQASRANVRHMYLSGVARLRPGVSPRDAEADLRRLIPSLAEVYADATPELLGSSGLTPVVRPLKEVVVGDVAATLWILFGGVGLLLVLACANVANLFLVRADDRRAEVALRETLGARQRHVARHLLGESAVVSGLGGLLGLVLAARGTQLLIARAPDVIPRLDEVRVDGFVLGFTAGITVLAALFFAGLPLARYGRPGFPSSLSPGARATPTRAGHRARRILVAAQMAIALVLLTGAGLLVRSLRHLQQTDLGFDPVNVLTFQPAMSYARYPTYRAAAGLQVRLLERLRAVPGVTAAEAASDLPLVAGPTFGDVGFAADESPAGGPGVGLPARFSFATPGYFRAMGIPLLDGRTFQPGDLGAETPPVILSAGFARTMFSGADPIGRRIRVVDEFFDGPPYVVVGVVGDVAGERPGSGPLPTAWFPVLPDPATAQFLFVPGGGMSIVVRADRSPAALMTVLRQVVAEVDPGLPIASVRTMEQIVADSMARHRFAMLLMLVAALASLFLGTVGLYGAMSYVVGRRTREIGVRIALGARSGQVTRMVLRQGTTVALTGLAIGIPAALVLTRFLRSLLFGVSPTDPVVLAATSGLLLAVALLASYLPAHRAARVDPMEALRHE